MRIWHARCDCPKLAVEKCKDACDRDNDCKGFVEVKDGGCQLATSSGKCPGCETYWKATSKRGFFATGELLETGSIIDRGRYCGCWRKVVGTFFI